MDPAQIQNLHYNIHSSYVLMSYLQAKYFQETDIIYFVYFINFRFNVCVLAALIIGICST